MALGDVIFPRRALLDSILEFKAGGVPLDLLQRGATMMDQVDLSETCAPAYWG